MVAPARSGSRLSHPEASPRVGTLRQRQPNVFGSSSMRSLVARSSKRAAGTMPSLVPPGSTPHGSTRTQLPGNEIGETPSQPSEHHAGSAAIGARVGGSLRWTRAHDRPSEHPAAECAVACVDEAPVKVVDDEPLTAGPDRRTDLRCAPWKGRRIWRGPARWHLPRAVSHDGRRDPRTRTTPSGIGRHRVRSTDMSSGVHRLSRPTRVSTAASMADMRRRSTPPPTRLTAA